MDYGIAYNPGVVPWMGPTPAGAGTISITNPALSDYAISTSETSTASCDVSGTPTEVIVIINDRPIALVDQGGGSWSAIVQGNYVGECSAVDVIFVGGKTNDADHATAPNTLTVTKSAVKVNPDPLRTIWEMVKAGWDRTETDDEQPDILALVDEMDDHERRGIKEKMYENDTIIIYEINESQQSKGTSYNNFNRIDAVSIDMHTNGTRAHFRKMIDMLRYLFYAERKHPITYPSNADYPYDALHFEGQGQEFSSKATGHYRIIFTVRLLNYWEWID